MKVEGKKVTTIEDIRNLLKRDERNPTKFVGYSSDIHNCSSNAN